MFQTWFSDNTGIVTFAVAMATVAAAGLAVWLVCRRYSPRAAVGVVLGVLAASLTLPWLSFGAAATAKSPVRPLPTASAPAFVHALDSGKIRTVAELPGDLLVPGATVFETTGGKWELAVVPPHALGTAAQAREAQLTRTTLPQKVRRRVIGVRNDDLIAFLVLEVLATVIGAMTVLSVMSLPRRVDLDKALARLVAGYHGHETV